MRIYPDDTVDDEFRKLGELGHTGALNDRQKGVLEAIGFTGAITDGFGKYRAEGNFNPYVLNGEMFLDPSDISTLFQDTAGTTPVTSPGDPVGLVLDKSKGLRLGPELSATIYGQNASNFVTSLGDNTFRFHGDGSSFSSISFDTAAAGIRYLIEPVVISRVSGAIKGNDTTDSDIYAAFTSTPSVKRWEKTSKIEFGRAVGGQAIDITVRFSVRALPGNHVTAPSDAARPVYQTSGGLHWLEFDGVDDQLEADTRFGFSANPAMLVTCGIRSISYTGGSDRVFQIGTRDGSTSGTIAGALGTEGLSWRHNNGNKKFGSVNTGSDYVLSLSRQSGDTYGDQLGYIDGALSGETDTSNPTETPTQTTAAFTVGSGGTEYLNMRLYSLVVLGEHTATQQALLEGWTARKAGVTL